MESLNSYLRGLKGSENVRIVDHPDEDRTDRVMVAARELVPGDVILTERPLLHTSQSFARSFRPDPSIPTLPPDYQRVEYEFIRRYTARSREQHENDQSRDEALFNVAMKLLSTDGVDGETATEAFPRRRKDYERGLKVFLKLVKKEYKRNAAATAATVDEEEPMDVADAKGQTKSALKREGDDAVQISSPAPKRRKISGPESFDTANLPPISDLLRLVSILETNCHSRAHSFKNEPVAATSPDDADPPRDESLGLYLAGSFMDHSCAPNATVVLRGVSQSPEDAGVLTLLCLRTIPPNTPITINYTDSEFIPTKERRQTLFRRGFLCACEACCGRDIARAGICSGSCGGIGIVSPTPIEDGSESEDQADDSAVEDPSGETLMFSCDICARRYSSQQANKFIEAEDAIGADIERQMLVSEGVLEVVRSWSEAIQNNDESDEWSGFEQPTETIGRWNDQLVKSIDEQQVPPIHICHSSIYQFLKENLYANPSFRIVFTHKHSPLHATLYLVGTCLRLLGVTASRFGELAAHPNSIIAPDAQVIYSEDLRHNFLWLSKMAKEVGNGTLKRWASKIAKNMTQVMYGENSDEVREVVDI